MEDLLRTQLSQTRDALRAAEQLRQAAETEYRIALKTLHRIAETLLPGEWNALRREQPDTDIWSAEQLGNWIISTAERKLRRAETLSGGVDLEALITERDKLRHQMRQVEEALALMENKYEELGKQLAAREAELARLRTEIVSLRDSNSCARESTKEKPVESDNKTPRNQQIMPGNIEIQALGIIGSRGYCLRADIARALGLDVSSGATYRLFESLRNTGWIEEEQLQAGAVGVVGRPPNLLRLSELGRKEYKQLFGAEPVESEYDRLLARHKSAEHVLLNLLARDVLLAAGAESVDLYPRPVAIPGGGIFDVDIVAVLDGKSLYVEAERPTEKRSREWKWTTYAAVTKEFHIIVPNKEAKTTIISEISLWAYRNPEQAAGVTLRVCQLSAFDGSTLWHHIQHFDNRGNR